VAAEEHELGIGDPVVANLEDARAGPGARAGRTSHGS
jgi:hypothetical protein